MTFAEKLKELRAAAGMSQSGLARASGMSLGAIHDYEQGKREPSMRSTFKLAAALGTDCRAFADCDDVSGPAEPPAAKKKTEGKDEGKAGRKRKAKE